MNKLLWCLPLLCWAQPASHLSNLKQLTSGGQNAEAYWSSDGKRLIFQSTRDGRDCDQIYIMNADGSGVRMDGTGKKRITTAEGYDGGPVFSRDGSNLVWRAHHPDTPEKISRYRELLKDNLTAPMKMELFVSDSGGSNAREITSFGCASFAPTFTPDGKKILFSSNKHKCDSRDFELYLI